MITRPYKEKKSFTLSRSSVSFLKRLRQERNAPSTSLVLDELIQEADACQRRNSAEQAISAHYNSLSHEEKREQEAWGGVRRCAIAAGTQNRIAIPSKRLPKRGEIWFVKLHVDPLIADSAES